MRECDKDLAPAFPHFLTFAISHSLISSFSHFLILIFTYSHITLPLHLLQKIRHSMSVLSTYTYPALRSFSNEYVAVAIFSIVYSCPVTPVLR